MYNSDWSVGSSQSESVTMASKRGVDGYEGVEIGDDTLEDDRGESGILKRWSDRSSELLLCGMGWMVPDVVVWVVAVSGFTSTRALRKSSR